MWILMLLLTLLGAHFSLTALVPLQPGDVPAPWWVGGRLLWPFAVETRTLIPVGNLLNSITPIIAISSGLLFLMAAAALLRWIVPAKWFRGLIIAGAVLAIPLQIIWFTKWAILPILVNLVLLWAVFAKNITVDSLRG
jgi:hypothetical protein